MDHSYRKWHDARTKRGEVIGGGFFVFRRGRTTGRIKIDPAKPPFEHKTRDAALDAAATLARNNPGIDFAVFEQSAVIRFELPTDEA